MDAQGNLWSEHDQEGISAEFIDIICNQLAIMSLRAEVQSLVKWEAFFLSRLQIPGHESHLLYG